ncbi:MAG: DUF2079 domain-containing protein [Polyangiaceae bacterium]
MATQRDPSALPALARSLATLSAVGFSVVLATQLLWMQLVDRSNYTFANVLGAPGRNRLLLSAAVGITLPALIALLVLWRQKGPGLATLHRSATLLAPLALVFVVPGLFLSQVAEGKPLFYLVVLSAFGLASRALLGASWAVLRERKPSRLGRWLGSSWVFARLSALRLPRWAALLVVCLAAAGYASLLSRYAIAHHRLIQTVDTDVGIADNMMANLAVGHWFRAPALFGTASASYLSVHADYSALLFLPIYRLHPGAETLLRLQAVLAALCVIPIFLLAARLLSQRVAVWASLAFLSLAPLHGALLVTFSWMPAFCLFSFTLYYAVLGERRWLTWLALPLLLASSEFAPLAVVAFGIFLVASVKKTRLGLGLCVAGVTLLAFNTALAMHTGVSTPAPVLPPAVQALRALCSNPVYFTLDLARAAKLSSMLHALAPLALLPLSALGALPLIFPGVLFTSSSTEFWPGGHSAFPLVLVWIPGALLSVLYLLHRLRQNPAQRGVYLASLITLTLTLLSHSYDYGALLRADGFGGTSVTSLFQGTPATDKRYADAQSVLSRLPANASVVATTYVLSHVSNRAEVFSALRPYGEPEYVFFSSLELVGAAHDALSITLSTHHFLLLANAGEFYLFKRGPETSATTQTLRILGLLRDQSPPTPSPGPSDPPPPPHSRPAGPGHRNK